MTGGKTQVLVYADSRIYSGAESLLCDLLGPISRDPDLELSLAVSGDSDLSARFSEAVGAKDCYSVPSQRLALAAFDLYNPVRQSRIGAVIAEAKPDVILLNLPSAEYGSTPLLVKEAQGIPIVGLMHISGTMGELDFRLGGIRERLARKGVAKLDTVLLLSDEAKRRFPSQWRPKDATLKVIRMPVPEVERIDAEVARNQLGLPSDQTLIATIGRLTVKQKGQDTLVEAASRMLKVRDDLGFVLAGDGKDRGYIEKMVAERGLTGHFHFLGQVSDVASVLSAADFTAIPSRFEGLPLVALEAIVAGVPGVATSVDGLCDVWPDQWRVEPGDPDQLAAKMLALIEAGDGAQDEMVTTARKLMESRTSEEPSAQIASNLKEAVKSSRD